MDIKHTFRINLKKRYESQLKLQNGVKGYMNRFKKFFEPWRAKVPFYAVLVKKGISFMDMQGKHTSAEKLECVKILSPLPGS